jgi:KDO2-lipid IV(A) lauroyltransferase
MYRPHKLRILNFFVERNMKKHYENAIPRYNMLRMVKTLKNKRAVWYSTDVNAGRKHSVFAPFFGVQAATTKAPVRLTKLTGCKVLTLKHFRRKDGKGYVAEVSDPLDNFPSGDAQADAARINAITEAAIRECPEQYLWQYKRFKTRPNKSDKKFY